MKGCGISYCVGLQHYKHRQGRGGLSKLNKDHQRMMVDLMVMIVQNVKSFLTAVPPTAVTQTAVILLEFT